MSPEPIRQAGYPGYLGRLRKAGNGYLLACLSRRDPLIEFLKTEPAFVGAMKTTHRAAALDRAARQPGIRP